MDFTRFKSFIRQHNDTLILFEQGEPEIVMMSFGEYERLLSRGAGNEGDRTATREWSDSVIPRQEASGLAVEDALNPMDDPAPFLCSGACGDGRHQCEAAQKRCGDDPGRDAEWPAEANAVSQATQAFPHTITTPTMSSRTPIRLEDVQLEDLPIEGF